MGADAVLAFDIGGTRLKAGLVTDGRVVDSAVEPVSTRTAAALTDQLVEIGRRLADGRALSAVGAAVKGIVDSEAGVVTDVNAPLEALSGTELARDLQQAFGVPAAIENDARLFAYGELCHGAGQGAANLVGVTLGTGVGVGVVVRGELLPGGRGILAGHLTVDFDGPACECGNRGCIEAFLGSAGLVRELPGAADPQAVFEAAAAGEPLATAAVARFAEVLGAAVTTWINAYEPDLVVLGGGLARSAHLYLDTVQAITARQAWTVPRGRVRIEVSSLGDDAALLGAATYAAERAG